MRRPPSSATYSRWLPAAVIPSVIVAAAAIAPLGAAAAVDLPDLSANEVLELLAASQVDAFSGTVEQSSDLGLPDLSGLSGGDGSEPDVASALELVTGTHTARVFVDGPELARVQVMDQLAERNIVRNGDEVWVYDSSDSSATHLIMAAEVPDAGVPPTPGALADRALADLGPSTAVTVGPDATVAGRSAYGLVLTPRDPRTTVGSVSIAVDSETGLALAFQITARGQDEPAFRVAFTELTLGAPDADLFAFEPPAGATVTERVVEGGSKEAHATADAPGFAVTGEGWSSIVEVSADDLPAELVDSPLYSAATEPVAGGRLLGTALVNVLLTDDGRVFAGAVSPEQLLDAADAR